MFIHVVSRGETLWRIASTYGVSLQSIIELNGLEYPDQLVVGQALIISGNYYTYTVRRGDTLWKIAQAYGITVGDILRMNQISDPNSIRPSMRIRLPLVTHRIRPGETLYYIAGLYGVPLRELLRINNRTAEQTIYPGDTIVIPAPFRPLISVNAYIYMLGQQAVPIISEVGEQLTYLSPFAYLIREDGTLESIDDVPAVQAAVNNGAVPMMSITNFTVTSRGENTASIILNSPSITEKLLSEVISVMRTKGYRGLNVDFENVLPSDREAYNRFLETTVARLHPLGYFVSTALAPKEGPEQAGLLYEAHDYPAHGRIVDFVILMTYEWGYRKGPPQAISPINKIRQVLDYAVSVIPREKIYMGFQIYARDWLVPHIAGQEAETISCQEAVARAVRYGAEINYDTLAQSPNFRYTDEQGRRHEVWFEDARSAQAKFDTVKDYGLAGISYWALGYPYPQNWVLLNHNFRIRRL